MELAAQHQATQQVEGNRHLNTAIGAYRGSTTKRAVLVGMLGSLARSGSDRLSRHPDRE
jgi:hypothetical protein